MRLRRLGGEAVTLGFLFTGFQLLVALLAVPDRPIGERYLNLCRWDCLWYENIARHGYHSTVPPVRQNWNASNVAFFPAYPYLARGLFVGLGLPPKVALLAVAQIFCVVFWAVLWLTLRKWRIPPGASVLVLFAILAHPAAFFLVAGYSESLFLSLLLLFLLTAPSGGRRVGWSAALSGFAMSATRLIGVPAAGFPVVNRAARMLMKRSPETRAVAIGLLPAIVLSGVAMTGALLFFGYCWVRFGELDLYMQTQRIGWKIVTDYGVLWKWREFHYTFAIDAIATRASAVAFVFAAWTEYVAAHRLSAARTGLRRRLPVYLIAFVIFFITLSGLVNVGFRSMVRYTLPWAILLLLCQAQLFSRAVRMPRALAVAGFITASVLLLVLFRSIEFPHFGEFLHGKWFA